MSDELTIFGEGSLLFQEFASREPFPLAVIHRAVLEFLCGREDVVLSGAHAVNAFVSEPRMTQDVDVLAIGGCEFAEDMAKHLDLLFDISTHLRVAKSGLRFRIEQLQNAGNRHLVDVRSVTVLPPSLRVAKVLVVTPEELIANKVQAVHARRGQPKGGTDKRDLLMLFLAFPILKKSDGPIRNRLLAEGADAALLAVWEELVAQEQQEYDEDSEFN